MSPFFANHLSLNRKGTQPRRLLCRRATDPACHEVEATLIDAEVYLATRLPDNNFESSNNDDPPPPQSWRTQYTFIALIIIIGTMAGILGTLLVSRGNGSANETAAIIRVGATARPSSSIGPSSYPRKNPSVSPSDGPSLIPSALPSKNPSVRISKFSCIDRSFCLLL